MCGKTEEYWCEVQLQTTNETLWKCLECSETGAGQHGQTEKESGDYRKTDCTDTRAAARARGNVSKTANQAGQKV